MRLVCSDGGCAALYEAWGPPDELDALGCDCGCWLQPLGWSVPSDGPAGADLIPLR